MATVQLPCPECSKPVQSTAADCAHCGALFSDAEKKTLAYAARVLESSAAESRKDHRAPGGRAQARQLRPAPGPHKAKRASAAAFIAMAAVVAGAAFVAGRLTAPAATAERERRALAGAESPKASNGSASSQALPSSTSDDDFVQELKRERDWEALIKLNAEYQKECRLGNIKTAEELQPGLESAIKAYVAKWGNEPPAKYKAMGAPSIPSQ